jgi:putative flippase GtrA
MKSNPGEVLRFLAVGALNTLATYLIYLALLSPLGHRWAYTACFVSGVLIAFGLNAKLVFQARPTWGGLIRYPVVYAAQYSIGLLVVSIWVERLGWASEIAPLVAVGLSLPLTFVLSRWAIRHRET